MADEQIEKTKQHVAIPQKKKPGPKSPSPKAARTIKILLEKGGISVGEAMRQAGYAETTSQDPSKLTRTTAYVEAMNRAGLDTESLASVHRSLVYARITECTKFPMVYGRKNKKKQITDEQIKAIIECDGYSELLYIIDDKFNHQRLAYFSKPDKDARGQGLNLAMKARGDFAPVEHGGSIGLYKLESQEKSAMQKLLDENRT